MSLQPKKEEPKTESDVITQNMKMSKRDYKIYMLKEKKKYGMLNDFEKGQLQILESGLDE